MKPGHIEAPECTNVQLVRAGVSFAAALALLLFPIGSPHLSSTALFGVAVAITWFVLIVQIIGILPRPSVARAWEAEEEAQRAEDGGLAEGSVSLARARDRDGEVEVSNGENEVSAAA